MGNIDIEKIIEKNSLKFQLDKYSDEDIANNNSFQLYNIIYGDKYFSKNKMDPFYFERIHYIMTYRDKRIKNIPIEILEKSENFIVFYED